MRVNVYAEEITDRIEIIEKRTPDGVFTGVRFYLYLPVTINHKPGAEMTVKDGDPSCLIRGPFMHRENDDDSAAVTFWGKRDLRKVLQKALQLLDDHYAQDQSQTKS